MSILKKLIIFTLGDQWFVPYLLAVERIVRVAQGSGLAVHIAMHGERVLPGHTHVAPDGFQMGVINGRWIRLPKDEPRNGHYCPSESYLFCVAEVFGRNAVGVLLTRMGKDGAGE